MEQLGVNLKSFAKKGLLELSDAYVYSIDVKRAHLVEVSPNLQMGLAGKITCSQKMLLLYPCVGSVL